MNKRRAIGALVAMMFALSLSFKARAIPGASSGNAAGESSPTMAADTALPYPSPASNLRGTRETSGKVRLSWEGSLPTSDYKFVVFRSDGGDAWQKIVPSTPDHEYRDETATAGHDYRYTVAVLNSTPRFRPPALSGVYSAPSNEVQVRDTAATFHAGAHVYWAAPPAQPPPSQPPPSGVATLQTFITDEQVFTPLVIDTFPDFYFAAFWYWFDTKKAGFVPTGQLLTFAASIDSNEGYRAPFTGIEDLGPTNEIIENSTVTTFPDPLPPGQSLTNEHLDLNGSFAIFDADFKETTENQGFDGVFNPKWQMIPIGESRNVDVTISPAYDPDSDFEYGVSEGITPTPTSQPQGTTTVSISAEGPTRNGFFSVARHGLNLDILGEKTVTVAVYRVLRQFFSQRFQKLLNFHDNSVVKPTAAEINNGVNAILGPQANVRLSATIMPTLILRDDDGEFVMGTPDEGQFQDIADANGYDLTIFIMMSVVSESFGVKGYPAGVSNSVPGKFAFVRDKDFDVYAHECCHLMGLHHPFDSSAVGEGNSNGVVPDDLAQRLMSNKYVGGSGQRLIKPERDKIRTRFP